MRINNFWNRRGHGCRHGLSKALLLGALCAAPAGMTLLCRPQMAAAAEAAAQVVSVRGEVVVRHGVGDKAETPAVVGALSKRDEIETRGGGAAVKLPLGPEIELSENTVLAIIGGKVDLFLGHGTVRVHRVGDNKPEGRALLIQGGQGRVALKAKEAQVRVEGGVLRVTVFDGSAEITGSGNKPSKGVVQRGQMAELRSDGTISQPEAMPVVAQQPSVGEGMQAHAPVVMKDDQKPPIDRSTMATAVLRDPLQEASGGHPPVPSAQVLPPPQLVVSAQGTSMVPPPAAKQPFAEWTTLRLLRDKGMISQPEYDSALHDMMETAGQRAGDSVTLVLGKWATTLYGFVQGDMMWNSTQSSNDFISNAQIARPGTYAGDNGRMVFTVRDSRIGVRVQVPETKNLRLSATFELDLLGNTGTLSAEGTAAGPGTNNNVTEASYFTNPVLRIRHAYLKAETPIVDILFGQTWDLFGFLPIYVPTIVQWPGNVGGLYARTTQLRVSHTFKSAPVNFEMAIAAMRPPQRDSMVPEGQAGLRLVFNKWTAVHTTYMTSTAVVPASIAVSADIRQFSVPEFTSAPKNNTSIISKAIAASAYVPIVRGTKSNKSNSLSLVGEFVYGESINDLYTGLTGGVTNMALQAVAGVTPAFNPAIDAGLVAYDKNQFLRLPTWTTFMVGGEYYFPKVDGHLAIFGSFSRSKLSDSDQFAGQATAPTMANPAGTPSRVRDNEMMYDVGLFGDPVDALRIGIDYAHYADTYTDGVTATNHSVQAVGFLFF